MSTTTKQPAIARIWRGRTRRAVADEYEAYNYDVGIKPLIEKALGVQTFREDRGDETEFMTISYWESVEAMARFTGSDPARSTTSTATRNSSSSCQRRCRSCASSPATAARVERQGR